MAPALRALCALTAAVTAAALLGASPARAADLSWTLDGVGPQSGAPLEAVVQVTVLGPRTALVRLRNTSPPISADLPTAPVLTRLGFNLAGGPPARCLRVAEPSWWRVVGRAAPFCAASPGGPTKGAPPGFAYGLAPPADQPSWGVHAGEVVELLLTVDAACGAHVTLSPEAFEDAPGGSSAGQPATWAATFDVLGPGGGEQGCAAGDVAIPGVHGAPECTPEHGWARLVATTADTNGLPSLFLPVDNRAGSVEVNVNGGVGFQPSSGEPPFEAGIVTLRNGVNAIVEQWQVNRAWPQGQGCQGVNGSFVCWIDAAVDLVGTLLSAQVPTLAAGSNDGFDPSGERAAVSGQLHLDYSGGAVFHDNSHQLVVVAWSAPNGLDTAQLLLRAGYGGPLSAQEDNPLVVLFRRGFPQAPDYRDPAVEILVETDSSLVLGIGVQDALVEVCHRYVELGLWETGAPAP